MLKKNNILNLQYLAGFCSAAIIVAPMARAFLDVEIYLYVFLSIILFLFVFLSGKARKFHPFQAGWAFLLFALLISLFAASFPFSYDFRLFAVAAAFIGSTVLLAFLINFDWDDFFYKGFFAFILTVSLAISGLIFYGYASGGQDFRKVFDVGYLSTGNIASLGFCLSVPYFIFSQKTRKALWALISLLCFLGVIAGLSRGALLFSTAMALFLFCFYWPRQNGKQSMDIFQRLTIILGAAFLALLFLPQRTISRLNRLIWGQEAVEGGRGELWLNAVEFIMESPLIGHGLGHGGGSAMYPHNLFLQVGMDGGFLAMGILTLLIGFPLIVFIIGKYNGFITNQPLAWGFLAGYLFFVLELSKSGDFYKARGFFILASALIGYISMLSKERRRYL